MKKRIYGLFLAVCVLAGGLPTAAFGSEGKDAYGAGEDIKLIYLGTPQEAALAVRGELFHTYSFFGEKKPDEPKTEPNRIILRTDEPLDNTYGARQGYYYGCTDAYILEYEEEADTAYAYRMLTEKYGDDQVFLDELVSLEDTRVQGAGTAEAVFDGIHAMGLDTLKGNVEGKWKENVTVAVIDSGIYRDHTLFQGRLDGNLSTSLAGGTADDVNGHGTHVAGIIADGTPNAVKLMAVRVFDAYDYSTLFTICLGIDYAVEQGADVINLSLGDNLALNREKHMLDASFARAVEKGIVVCAASGNEYGDVAECYPASSRWTIAVGALKQTASGYERDNYSNYGSLLDFTAPGTNIKSAWIDGGYYTESGTSMASPHLAAAAAMVKLKHPDYDQWDVYAVFRDFSVDLGEPGWDKFYGYGLVRMDSYDTKETLQQDGLLHQGIRADAVLTKSIKKDTSFPIEAEISRGNGHLSYASSRPDVASVSGDTVTIHKAGVCELILTASQTTQYKKTERRILLVVNKLPQKIDWPAQTYTKKSTDKSFSVSAKCTEGDGKISYVGSNDDVISVREDGLVKILGGGTAKIYAVASETGVYARTVSEPVTITVQKASQTLQIPNTSLTKIYGKTKFSLHAKSSSGERLYYKNSNPSVAAVSSSGIVTMKRSGKTTITVSAPESAKYKSGGSKKIILTVKKAVPVLKISDKTVSVTAKPFYLKVKNSGSGKLRFTSSNKKVASVSKKGKVTVKKIGTAVLTVRAASDSRYSAAAKKIRIRVTPPKTSVRKLTAGKKSITVFWNKKGGISGYQIRYAAKKDMKHAAYLKIKNTSVTSKTIRGLRAKRRYYVQVRTYKKSAGKNYYSSWSTKRRICTK